MVGTNIEIKFTDIINKVKKIGKHTSEEMIETSTIQDEPEIFSDNEQDKITLEEVFKQK